MRTKRAMKPKKRKSVKARRKRSVKRRKYSKSVKKGGAKYRTSKSRGDLGRRGRKRRSKKRQLSPRSKKRELSPLTISKLKSIRDAGLNNEVNYTADRVNKLIQASKKINAAQKTIEATLKSMGKI